MESRVRSIRPQEVPRAHPSGRRDDGQHERPQRAFTLDPDASSAPSEENQPNTAPDERDVSSPAPDEAGRRIDLTG